MMEGTNTENSFLPQFVALSSTENRMKNNIKLIGLPLLALLLLVTLPALAYNMTDADMHSPRPELPTRTPTAVPPTITPKQPTAVASIVLISDGDVDGLQTAVEWQDNSGNWHVVEGWQSPFNKYKQVTWAVAAADYGKGPFRWVVSRSNMAIMSSSDFYLPLSGNERVVTHIMP